MMIRFGRFMLMEKPYVQKSTSYRTSGLGATPNPVDR